MTTARAILAPLIAAARSPAQQRALAAALGQISAELVQRAEAAQRQQQRPAAQRVTPRSPQAGQGRAPASFVRIERVTPPPRKGHSQDRDVEAGIRHRTSIESRVRLYIGRALWYALGSPARIALTRQDGQLRITVARGDETHNYAVVSGSGMPRIWIDGARGLVKDPARWPLRRRGARRTD